MRVWHSSELNGVEQLDIDMLNTLENQDPARSIEERSETQLYTASVPATSDQKRWVSVGLW